MSAIYYMNIPKITQILCIFLLLSINIQGCPQYRTDRPPKSNHQTNANTHDIPDSVEKHDLYRNQLASSFKLDVGDVIEIMVYGEPDLKGIFQIYPGCKIQFPLIQNIKICGRTPGQIRTEIANKLHSDFFQQRPSVSVKIIEFNSKKIHVLGQVNKPGRFDFMPGLTLIQAIAMAGGFTNSASTNDTRLIRNIGSRKQIYRISLGNLGRENIKDTQLKPGDIIFVPKSWL
jgi:polysaccharide export outer membrane protein